MRLAAFTACALALAVGLLAFLAFGTGEGDDGDAAAAQDVALNWTGAELADAPRRQGDGWEVDVRRANGSVVEVTLGPALELRELDEELGPGGTPAHDELTGALRERAIAVARPEAGPGAVSSVERERDGTIEVNVVGPDQTVIEVELDRRLRLKDVDQEEFGDE